MKPRNPPRKGRKAEWKNPCYDDLLSDTNLVGNLIADIEKDHKSIPVLIRQYIRLGGQILAFNVDADFSDVVDGLIMVDLRKTEARARTHYMGTEAKPWFPEVRECLWAWTPWARSRGLLKRGVFSSESTPFKWLSSFADLHDLIGA